MMFLMGDREVTERNIKEVGQFFLDFTGFYPR